MVCLKLKLCDLPLSALEVRFSRRGAIQICVYDSGVAIGCAMHTGPALLGAQNLPDVVFSSNVDCIRTNLENHSLNYENRICSIRMQLAAS